MLFNYNEQKKTSMLLVLKDGKSINGEFIDQRISVESLPEGKKWYHIRHCDEDCTKPASLKKGCVSVNFFGTFICNPIPSMKCGDEIEIQRWNWDN